MAVIAAWLATASAFAAPSGAATAWADDRVPTRWQLQAGTAPLLTAPPPPQPATICVVDTGVTPTPDLEITARTSVIGGTPDDVQATPGRPGHGTVVAHFAAGKVNGWGSAGAFPHARIASVRVFHQNGRASWQDYLAALDRCHWLDSATKVILLALGGRGSQEEVEELKDKIGVLRRVAKINVVAAAGNGGGETEVPGAFPASFTVAGQAPDGALCAFSARGSNTDIAAPGCDLDQAAWDGAPWTMSGTSYAAPIVAGVLAALRSYDPTMGPDEAESAVLASARPGPISTIDAAAAFRLAGLEGLLQTTLTAVPVTEAIKAAGASPLGSSAADPAVGQSWVLPPGRMRMTRLPTPRLRLRAQGGGRLLIRAANRPRGAWMEVRVGVHHVIRRTSRVRLNAGGARLVRARFVTELSASRWSRVRIARRKASSVIRNVPKRNYHAVDTSSFFDAHLPPRTHVLKLRDPSAPLGGRCDRRRPLLSPSDDGCG